MTRAICAAGLALGALLAVTAVMASPSDRLPGSDAMGSQTRAMQEDDSLNPGMLWVLDGEELWNQPAGAAGRACAGCHGDARASMRGVATRYPAFDAAQQGPISLDGRIQACRRDRQQAPPLAPEDDDRLALLAFVAHQSRGLPIAAAEDPRLLPFVQQGRELFERRQGQLALSCADCHDRHQGQRLGGSVIPGAHPTGYPIYRLEWQAMGSLQRRLRNCMVGVRAEPYPFDSRELVGLELYLMWRARGQRLQTPGVRP
jgi:sulfur-oxidizing protein SoxA